MDIQKQTDADYSLEYGTRLRRLYPWKGVVNPEWGTAIAIVPVGGETTIHSHDEKETFLILAGKGMMTVDGESQEMVKGDLVYLPAMSEHKILNISDTEELEFLSIWWDTDLIAKTAKKMELNEK